MARMSYIPPTSGQEDKLASSQVRGGKARQRHAVTPRRPCRVRPEPRPPSGDLLTDVIETFGRAWDEAVAS